MFFCFRSGLVWSGLVWSCKALKHLIRPLRALYGPYKGLKGHIEPLGALSESEGSYNALNGLIRPLRALYGPYKALKGFKRPYKALTGLTRP